MKLFLIAATVALMATGTSASTTGSWSFNIGGGRFYGSVTFAGTDKNNDGIISGAEVTSLQGSYGGGPQSGPGHYGVSFNETNTILSYDLDGIFGNTYSDYVSYSSQGYTICDFYFCIGRTGVWQKEVYISQGYDFYNNTSLAIRKIYRTAPFEIISHLRLNEIIGPQLVNGPTLNISAVPLPASSGFLLAGLAALLACGRRRKG